MTTALQCEDRQGVEMMRPEPSMTTTLYDLIWALQTVVPPGEDDAVVSCVASWMHDGRIRAAREVSPL
ncbi:MAG: hypothetical protein ETSY1_06805 [Candidatus Entotheonella factor]|uniref:Uncharacterized protein n=1 Tax=Entotheonella factor TaxID=1429438 RepID=W4LW26_ENTF1|nr:MAG: hypothetical protein ETSY1_06805 [Candidatus Entotheonella factor]